MIINNSTQEIKVKENFQQQVVLVTNHFRQAFKPQTKTGTEKDCTYHNIQLFISKNRQLLTIDDLTSIQIRLSGLVNIIEDDLSGITGFFRYLFYGDIKKALKEEARQIRETITFINPFLHEKNDPSQFTAPSPLVERRVSELTAVPTPVQTAPAPYQKPMPVQQAQAGPTKTSEPTTPAVNNEVAPSSPRTAIPRPPISNPAAPPPPVPPPPNVSRAPGAPPPPLPAAKRFVGEVAEPKVSVTTKELDPNRKAKEGERSSAEIHSLVEQEIVTITAYIDTMKKSLKSVEDALKRSEDITTQLDSLKIIYTPIKQKINNYNQILEQLNHHIETFGIQIPKEKEVLKFPVLDHQLFAEVAAELQKEGKDLSLKFSAEEIQSTLQMELETLTSQFSQYEKDRAELQEELKSILNQENNGIKFSAYKKLFDSKTKIVKKWERALKNRKDFLTKQKQTNKSEVKVKANKTETVAPIEENLSSLSPEEQERKAKVREIIANIKKLFSIQNFAILMRAATVTPLVDLFKTTIIEVTDRGVSKEREYLF